jgi:hypothetical protein
MEKFVGHNQGTGLNAKITGTVAAATLVLTLIWLAQMIGIAMKYGSIELFDDALAFAKEQHWFYRP